MHLLKLVQDQVHVGVALPWNVRDECGQLLLACGYRLRNDDQLFTLLDRGIYVDREEFEAVAHRLMLRDKPPEVEPVPLHLLQLWQRALWRLNTLLRACPDEPDFPAQMTQLAQDVIGLIERDPDVGIFLSIRQERHPNAFYSVPHSLYSALVAYLMAQRLAWDAASTLTLVKAALTMNCASIDEQDKMAAQECAPSSTQRKQIHEHPMRSVALLQAAGVRDADWLKAVAQHHERTDGSGYPAHVTDVALMAQALHHADVYMAKISPRSYRQPMTIQQAARDLFQEDKGGAISSAIIKTFGIYPPGNFVRLRSGEIAVVIRRGDHANAPIVASVTNSVGSPVVNTTLRKTADSRYAIVGLETQASVGMKVPPERLYGLLH